MTSKTEVHCASCNRAVMSEVAQTDGWKREAGKWICDLCLSQGKKIGENLLKKAARWIWSKIRRRRR